ncbi:MAG: hypothetical protein H6728_01280 [Myxococcales bacterium]|nr:hypothetical protein [Myxococcales bacterium]MCB9641685.1 hypothetical protein [Myxococcales bacterium]
MCPLVWGLWSLFFLGGAGEVLAKKKSRTVKGKVFLETFQKQWFLQKDGKFLRYQKKEALNLFSEEGGKMLGEVPSSLQPLGRSKLWLGLMAGSLSVSILSFGGAIGIFFLSPNVLGGVTLDSVLFGVLLGIGLVTFPLALLFASPLGQSTHETVERYNQGIFEKALSAPSLTASQREAWSSLGEQRIYTDEQGWIRKGKQRLPANSAWHEDFFKEHPKHRESLRVAWRTRIAGISLLSAGGLAMLGGIATFALDPLAVFSPGGRILIPPLLSYGLWAGGLIFFGLGLALEVNAQNTYQRTLALYNQSLFQRALGLQNPPSSATQKRLKTLSRLVSSPKQRFVGEVLLAMD